MNRPNFKLFHRLIPALSVLCLLAALTGCIPVEDLTSASEPTQVILKTAEPLNTAEQPAKTPAPAATPAAAVQTQAEFSFDEIPPYDGAAYCAVNGNEPFFTDSELDSEVFEEYHELDSLGRCGAAVSMIGQELMPTESRESISAVKPSGWQSAKYDFVDGKYLYNRCHLIGFQLTGENANDKNLITGTRYMNVVGMLPFENMTADYIKETGNHVLYRVTPVFEGNNLVASGVLMEAKSVEDDGDGVLFCVFCYNVQPGVVIDYATGKSSEDTQITDADKQTYILNTGSRKFHLPSCSSVEKITEDNKQVYEGSRELLIAQGYNPCGSCKP